MTTATNDENNFKIISDNVKKIQQIYTLMGAEQKKSSQNDDCFNLITEALLQ